MFNDFTKIDANYTKKDNIKDSIPIWNKYLLTLEEAADYFGIGVNKLRNMSNEENCSFVLFNGKRKIICSYSPSV